MHLVAGFESNAYVEIAIEEMREKCHIPAERIAFVEMQPQQRPATSFDSIHYSDGSSSVDGVAVGAVILGIAGIIYGSRLWLGSVVMGVGGFIVGGFIGFFIDKWLSKRTRKKPIRHIEILLMVQCTDQEELSAVWEICRTHQAVSLGTHP